MTTDENGFDKYLERMKELAETVTVKDDHIVVNVHYEYNIPISACDTHAKVLAWVCQLSEKTWMSQDVLRYFIRVACRESKLELPR